MKVVRYFGEMDVSTGQVEVVAAAQLGLKVSFDLPTISNDYFLDHAPIV